MFKEDKGELGFTGLKKTRKNQDLQFKEDKGEPGLTCLKRTRENQDLQV